LLQSVQAARLIRFADAANAAAFLYVSEKTLARWGNGDVERHPASTGLVIQLNIP
jgi:hypothetical protein